LDDICLDVPQGSYCGIVGPNGSGKTTLAHILAGILTPHAGRVDNHGLRVGLVLANPENQVVSLVVEEDIAFGPENLGLDCSEIAHRIDQALGATHSQDLRHALTSAISGGQLAKVVFAGQLALDVDVLVLDEGTVMLDPANRLVLLETVCELNRTLGKTIIHISHRLDDLEAAACVIALVEGRIHTRAPGVIELIEAHARSPIPGIEPGTRLVYRGLLRERGLDDTDLPAGTRALAGQVTARSS